MRNRLTEESVLLVSILKWFFLATLVGTVVGGMAALFLKALGAGTGLWSRVPYYFLAMPAALALSSFLQHHVFPPAGAHNTDDVIKSIHHFRGLPLFSVLEAFVMPILTIVAGGSAGKEAPAADMGAGLGSWLARRLGFDSSDRRKLMICGVSAGFAAVFGTPLSGAIFGVEVLFVGSLLYEVLLPAFVSGIVGCQIASDLGITYFPEPLGFVPAFSEVFFLKVALAGLFFGLCSFLLIESMHWTARISKKVPLKEPVKGLLAGLVLAVLTLIFSTRYLGMGLETMQGILEGALAPWYDFPLKILFTSITLNFGGAGGIVTPIFFIGTTAGSFFGRVLGLSPSTFAAIGLVSMLAGAANTPIAASIMAVELFGKQIAPYAAVACVISFLMTGHRSVYPSQVLAIRKSASIEVGLGKKMEELEPAFHSREGSLWSWGVSLGKRWLKRP